MDLQELEEDRFVHVVGNRFPDLFNVLEVSVGGADGGMRQDGEEPLDEPGGFAGLEQVGDHLVDEIGNDVSILVLPIDPILQPHLPYLGGLAGNGAQGQRPLTLLVGFEGTFEEVQGFAGFSLFLEQRAGFLQILSHFSFLRPALAQTGPLIAAVNSKRPAVLLHITDHILRVNEVQNG